MATPISGRRPRLAALSLAAAAIFASVYGSVSVACASVSTISYDLARSGWDSNEPSLTPATVTQGGFGEVFDTALSGQIYAQPLVVGSMVVVATEDNTVAALDRTSGRVNWRISLGPAEPASVIGCTAPSPLVGITSTPVFDPASGTVYVVARSWDGVNASSARYDTHALNALNGRERPGWPVPIAGTATNDAAAGFVASQVLQRPGLMLLGGRVFAGFGGLCDIPPYKGWIASVSASTSTVRMWTTTANTHAANGGEGAVWMSGAGLASDRPDSILLATGNGAFPAAGPGNVHEDHLGNSVVRLSVQPDGSLVDVDHFAPWDSQSQVNHDRDLGSAGPVPLPDSFGVAGHPHLLVQASKSGMFYLLDRDALGGMAQGPSGTDAVVAESGPADPVYGHPAVWPGDGGYIYFPGFSSSNKINPSALDAYQVQTDGGGVVSLTRVASASPAFGYGSGSPVVTSTGTQTGSALVWVIERPSKAESAAELRAYDPVPVGGALHLHWRAPLGHMGAKFSEPAIDAGKVYVGTEDGHVLAFGIIGARPGIATPTSNSRPSGVAAGPDGNVWITERSASRLAKVTPGGAITEFPTPTASSGPASVVTGADGALWFTEAAAGRIGRSSTTGTITEFPLPVAGADPEEIAAGPDGNLWFTESAANQIGRISPTGSLLEYPLPTAAAGPSGINAGPDGAVWFTETAAGKVGRITTVGAITEFPLASSTTQPAGITTGPDGQLWFTEAGTGVIGEVTPGGVITEHPLPTGSSQPTGLAVGSDGAIWFSEPGSNAIGRLTVGGSFSEYPSADLAAGLDQVATGPDGGTWFTESQAGRVGHIGPVSGSSRFMDLLAPGYSPAAGQTLPIGNAAVWTFIAPRAGSATDTSGMNLFDSGPQMGSTFSFTFYAAGSYAFLNTAVQGQKGSIVVPPQSSPTTGSAATTFALTWASIPAPTGFVYDVYTGYCPAAPCNPTFSPWLTGTSQPGAAFSQADPGWHGAGIYKFESRLRASGTGAHSLFAATKLVVS